MALTALDPQVKTALETAGITLTPTQEHLAANSKINWLNLLADLGQAAKIIVPIILALIGDLKPAPAPTPAMKTAPGCCNHYQCCCTTLKAILYSAKICADHCCTCCEGGYG